MATEPRLRKINVAGRQLHIAGPRVGGWPDPYYEAMTVSWPKFFGGLALAFLALNLAFTVLYSLQPGCVANLSPPGALGIFFFSVETLATVGYGDMHPITLYAHLVTTLEIFVGLTSVAIVTGVTFARFSRPRSRIVASNHIVINTSGGRRLLMVRAANARNSSISQATAAMHLVRTEHDEALGEMRRLYDLPLVRSDHPMFFLTWTLIHVIDEHSPLAHDDAASLEAVNASLILTLTGFDDKTLQQAHSRHIYRYDDVRWEHTFADMIERDASGRDVIDFERLHQTLKRA